MPKTFDPSGRGLGVSVLKEAIRQTAIQHASYTAMLRFVLADQERRLFLAQRFCFRGGHQMSSQNMPAPPSRSIHPVTKAEVEMGGTPEATVFAGWDSR